MTYSLENHSVVKFVRESPQLRYGGAFPDLMIASCFAQKVCTWKQSHLFGTVIGWITVQAIWWKAGRIFTCVQANRNAVVRSERPLFTGDMPLFCAGVS